MKIKPGMKLNQVCGESFIVPMGEENIDLSKLISLNESSLVLWRRMEEGEFTIDALVQALCDEYEVDEATARKDVEDIVAKLVAENVIDQ